VINFITSSSLFAEPENTIVFNQGEYSGELSLALGKTAIGVEIQVQKYPKNIKDVDLVKKISVWILLPDGAAAHLVYPTGGETPSRLSEEGGVAGPPNLIYAFDRFPVKTSSVLVLRTDKEYRIFPLLPDYIK
jgi:hypothetical protein